MNKYTLSFKSQKLEEQYQKFHQNNCVPTIRLLNLISFVLCLFRTITFLVFNQMVGFIIFLIATFIVIIAQLCIMNHKKELTDYYLLFMNIIIMFYQIYVEDGFEPQEAFVFGQNQMLIHAAMILISDFKFGAIQVLANIAIKVAISKYFQPSITFQTLLYSFAIGFMFLYSIYTINRKYRMSFLFTTQDTQYEQMIPLFTECPFALCTYDETNVQFKLKFSNLNNHQELNLFEKNQDNLNNILRSYQIYGTSFEQFLLNRAKNHDNLIQNKLIELIHQSNHKKMLVRYSECWTTELMHIIIIDVKRQEILKLKQKINTIEKKMNKFQLNIRTFFKNQMKILDKSLNNDKQHIYQAIIKLMYILTKLRGQNEEKIVKLQFLQTFKKYAKLFQKAYQSQKIIYEFCNETKDIITVQNSIDELLVYFFCHLFKIKFTTISIFIYNSFYQQNEYIDIIVKMDNYTEMYINLQKDTQFRKILRMISPHDYVLLQDSCLTIRLYKNLSDVHQLYSYSVN